MSKTATQMILCQRCGSIGKETDDACTRCGFQRYAPHKCDTCGEPISRRVHDILGSCVSCARGHLDNLAYKYATLDANIKQLEEL